jgi:heme-degrading monooxygenase HmoA
MVTVGMNYEVLPGKEQAFEKVFDRVVEIMNALPGHEETHLYRAAENDRAYLIISRWSNRAAFDAFTKSERFLKVASWGKEQTLATSPRHEVYGGDEASPPGLPSGCPVAH